MRRYVPLVSAVFFLAPMFSTAVGRAADTEAEQAAREIADARDRANAAADAYFDSESRIEELALQENQLESEIAALEGDVKALQLSVENVAIGRYTRSGSTGVPLLTGFTSPEDQVKVDALLDVIYDSSANDFDRFDALNSDLADKRQRLADKKVEAENERANLALLKDAATAEVERLKEVEADRLKDQAVRDALLAVQAQRKRDTERKKLLSAPAPTTTIAADPGAAAPPASGSGAAAAPLAAPVPSSGAATRPSLPDTGGGQTGGGGGGSFGAGGGNDYAGVGWVCPTGSAAAPFGDTWGAPRSGGRRHQGVDMIGSRGTPLLAVVGGTAEAKTNALGGQTVWLSGNDGHRYYYAHMDDWGKLGAVNAGDVIGHIGQTGNAQFSIAHLHFEIHPGGGPAVNPYPTVAAHCPSTF